MTEPARIVLISHSDATRRSWTDVLHTTADCVVVDVTDESAAPDVIVTDQRTADSVARYGKEVSRGEIGVIVVGADGPADVSLPSDATDRELRLACLLLTQIVRLRCRHQEDKRIRRVLSHLALSDPLTGLPNRRAWGDESRRRVVDAADDTKGVCLALLDLDNFKTVNDTLGHAAGDELLIATARAITASLRPGDFVARLGGDEFALLICGVDPGVSATVVERVRHAVADAAVDLSGGASQTASIGYAVDLGGGAAALLAAADNALRQAKRQGRNCSVRAGVDDVADHP